MQICFVLLFSRKYRVEKHNAVLLPLRWPWPQFLMRRKGVSQLFRLYLGRRIEVKRLQNRESHRRSISVIGTQKYIKKDSSFPPKKVCGLTSYDEHGERKIFLMKCFLSRLLEKKRRGARKKPSQVAKEDRGGEEALGNRAWRRRRWVGAFKEEEITIYLDKRRWGGPSSFFSLSAQPFRSYTSSLGPHPLCGYIVVSPPPSSSSLFSTCTLQYVPRWVCTCTYIL